MATTEIPLKDTTRGGSRAPARALGGLAIAAASLALLTGSHPPRALAGGQPPAVPPVRGFYQGREVFFIHTETSSPQVAKLLTMMMRSPVFVVPALARVPRSALANVYVFTNGVPDGGPLGFQPDVFDNAPGTPGYSPLRALSLVSWARGAKARVLRSAAAVVAAAKRGELSITRPGIVVNMPFLTGRT